jgi:hypothetical protein
MEDGIRMGCMAKCYSKIAMLNYLKGKELIEECSDYWDLRKIENKINDSIIISVVFSAMTIESFINDYAARKLGDKFFEENIDRLQPISKLQIIAKFVFRKELNKSENMFYLLTKLFRTRNEYIHNKSKDGFSYFKKNNLFFDEEDALDFEKQLYIAKADNFEVEFNQEKKKKITEDLQEAKEAISAIYELVKFFDSNDDNNGSKFMLLHDGYSVSLNDNEAKMITELNRKFGFPECRANSM